MLGIKIKTEKTGGGGRLNCREETIKISSGKICVNFMKSIISRMNCFPWFGTRQLNYWSTFARIILEAVIRPNKFYSLALWTLRYRARPSIHYVFSIYFCSDVISMLALPINCIHLKARSRADTKHQLADIWHRAIERPRHATRKFLCHSDDDDDRKGIAHIMSASSPFNSFIFSLHFVWCGGIWMSCDLCPQLVWHMSHVLKCL